MGFDLEWDIARTLVSTLRSCGADGERFRGVDIWRDMWERNKAWAFPYLGPDGRLESKIVVAPTRQDVQSAFEQAANVGISIAAGEKYKELFEDCWFRGKVLDFLMELALYGADPATVAANRFASPVSDPLDPRKTLPAGTRFTKYFVRYMAADEAEAAGALRAAIETRVATLAKYGSAIDVREATKQVQSYLATVYSQVMQGALSGEVTIALSANPVDMLLASAHTTGWRSCHAIYDGAFATGPVDYLVDRPTLIAFAYRDALPINSLPSCETSWPRKLWRQMVYFDPEAKSAVMSREYPGASEPYAREARALAALLLSRMHDVPHNWKVGSAASSDEEVWRRGDGCIYAGRRYAMRVWSQPWHYPDHPSRVVRMSPSGVAPDVRVGVEDLPCARCGELRNSCYDLSTGSLFCPDCRAAAICCVCGARLLQRSVYTSHAGNLYCRSCYVERFFICDVCGEEYDLAAMTEDAYYRRLCPECLEHCRVRCSRCQGYYRPEDIERADDADAPRCSCCVDALDDAGVA